MKRGIGRWVGLRNSWKNSKKRLGGSTVRTKYINPCETARAPHRISPQEWLDMVSVPKIFRIILTVHSSRFLHKNSELKIGHQSSADSWSFLASNTSLKDKRTSVNSPLSFQFQTKIRNLDRKAVILVLPEVSSQDLISSKLHKNKFNNNRLIIAPAKMGG